jgi:hypothetical protein
MRPHVSDPGLVWHRGRRDPRSHAPGIGEHAILLLSGIRCSPNPGLCCGSICAARIHNSSWVLRYGWYYGMDGAAMPKAPINEYSHLRSKKCNVWTRVPDTEVHSIAQPKLPQGTTQRYRRRCIASPDPSHIHAPGRCSHDSSACQCRFDHSSGCE